MTLFSRKDIGFGRAAVYSSVTPIGDLANRTMMVEMVIVCISTAVVRNGMMPIVIGAVVSNLCVKLMHETS